MSLKPKRAYFRNQNNSEIWALYYIKVLPSEDLKSYKSGGETQNRYLSVQLPARASDLPGPLVSWVLNTNNCLE